MVYTVFLVIGLYILHEFDYVLFFLYTIFKNQYFEVVPTILVVEEDYVPKKCRLHDDLRVNYNINTNVYIRPIHVHIMYNEGPPCHPRENLQFDLCSILIFLSLVEEMALDDVPFASVGILWIASQILHEKGITFEDYFFIIKNLLFDLSKLLLIT
jgi:hypothetical protein